MSVPETAHQSISLSVDQKSKSRRDGAGSRDAFTERLKDWITTHVPISSIAVYEGKHATRKSRVASELGDLGA